MGFDNTLLHWHISNYFNFCKHFKIEAFKERAIKLGNKSKNLSTFQPPAKINNICACLRSDGEG